MCVDGSVCLLVSAKRPGTWTIHNACMFTRQRAPVSTECAVVKAIAVAVSALASLARDRRADAAITY